MTVFQKKLLIGISVLVATIFGAILFFNYESDVSSYRGHRTFLKGIVAVVLLTIYGLYTIYEAFNMRSLDKINIRSKPKKFLFESAEITIDEGLAKIASNPYIANAIFISLETINDKNDVDKFISQKFNKTNYSYLAVTSTENDLKEYLVYFTSKFSKEIANLKNELLAKFPNYEFSFEEFKDPEWEQYKYFLEKYGEHEETKEQD